MLGFLEDGSAALDLTISRYIFGLQVDKPYCLNFFFCKSYSLYPPLSDNISWTEEQL